MTLNILTPAQMERKKNDRLTAAAWQSAKAQYPGTSRTRLIAALAEAGTLPFKSAAGIRASLIRTNNYND